MSNRYLDAALRDISRSGAKKVPSASTVMAAADETTWSGVKGNGDAWSLTKHGAESYDASC